MKRSSERWERRLRTSLHWVKQTRMQRCARGRKHRSCVGEVGRPVNLNLPAGPRGHVPLRVFAEHLHKVRANTPMRSLL